MSAVSRARVFLALLPKFLRMLNEIWQKSVQSKLKHILEEQRNARKVPYSSCKAYWDLNCDQVILEFDCLKYWICWSKKLWKSCIRGIQQTRSFLVGMRLLGEDIFFPPQFLTLWIRGSSPHVIEIHGFWVIYFFSLLVENIWSQVCTRFCEKRL